MTFAFAEPRAGDEGPRGEGEPHLLLGVAGAVLAVRAADVREVWEAGRCFPIPRTPAYVLGVANWRGTPVPVLDLAAALALRDDADARELRERLAERRVVVVTVAGDAVGLVADATLGVLEVDPGRRRPPTVVTSGRIAEFSRGEVDSPRGVAALLALDELLDATRVTP